MRYAHAALLLCALLPFAGCKRAQPDPGTVVLDIDSSPSNLDIRVGIDAQAEHIGALIFDSVVRKDEHYNLQPALAERWEWRDPLTLVLHIRSGVRFHDGKPLTAADVAWSIESMHNGALVTPKSGNFASVRIAEAVDPQTCVVHLLHPDAGLLFNMSDGLSAVVEAGAGKELASHPVGTGPFRFISEVPDKEVTLERNPQYWGGAPTVERVRFAIVPDSTTRALELQKGSADVVSNGLTADMVEALRHRPGLVTEVTPGSVANYIGLNTTDPALRDVRVRQALAYSIDRPLIIRALWRGEAALNDTLLPPSHWAAAHTAAATGNPAQQDEVTSYSYDPAKARALLDAAGYRPDAHGVRLTLTLKTSTDDSMRLLAAILQQQMRASGIDLRLRQNEFGTFYADVTSGAFQMYALRWLGANEDPDFFRYAYSTASAPPHGGNRGRYSNPEVDRLIEQGATELDQTKRRAIYLRLQQILSRDEPTLVLWTLDNVVVHGSRLHGVQATSSGTFAWLRTATLTP